jgi:hypothetical protein
MKDISSTRNILSLPTNNILDIIPEENALNAMREQWWFDIFDPNNSQFDVILIIHQKKFFLRLFVLLFIV